MRPSSVRASVDLPEPVSPISPTRSSAPIVSDMFRSTACPRDLRPYPSVAFSIRSSSDTFDLSVVHSVDAVFGVRGKKGAGVLVRRCAEDIA